MEDIGEEDIQDEYYDGCDCSDTIYYQFNSEKSTARMVRVFSPGENLETAYDDLCFCILLE